MSESVPKSEGSAKFPAKIGRYEITEKLGSGSTGTVYRATDPFIGRVLAIKTFRVDLQPGPVRDRSMPDVPTFAELGYPEFTAKVWFGLLVKKDTPSDILKRYTDAAVKAHNDPAVKAKLESQGFEVSGLTGPDKLRDEIKKQTVRWGQLVKASGFSVEDRGSTK